MMLLTMHTTSQLNVFFPIRQQEMGVLPEVSKAVQEMDWILPTDIQAEAVPLILGGGDIIMAAETGSGKTGAFSLPVIQIVYETIKELENPRGNKEASKVRYNLRLCLT